MKIIVTFKLKISILLSVSVAPKSNSCRSNLCYSDVNNIPNYIIDDDDELFLWYG